MTVYDIAAQLPEVEVLRRRCKALATLDAIVGGDFYTYDPTRPDGEAAAMRDGCGDEYDILFTAAGVFIRGIYHESPLHADDGRSLWPGLLDGLPDELQRHVSEPAFMLYDRLNATFVLWRRPGDERWHCAEGLDFSPADEIEEDPDGSWLLDVLLDDITGKYLEHAATVLRTDLDRDAVGHVTAFQPLTDAVIRALNPAADLDVVRRLAAGYGYPLAGQAPATGSRPGSR